MRGDWLPRAWFARMTIAFPDGEAQGRTLCIRWGRFVLEVAIARFPGAARCPYDTPGCQDGQCDPCQQEPAW